MAGARSPSKADGIHVNIRVEGGRQCILVVMGETDDGNKELVGIIDGERESEQSWRELLSELKSRGLERPPANAVGDDALGFWQALSEVLPASPRESRAHGAIGGVGDGTPIPEHGVRR